MKDPEYLVRTALSHHETGEIERAEALYRDALAIDGENIDALHLLGALVSTTGRVADAVPLLRHAVALAATRGDVNPGKILNNLGNALSALGHHEEAVAQYQGSLRADPKNPEVTFNLAGEFLTLGRIGEAMMNFRAVLTENTAFAPRLFELGCLHYRRWELPEAIGLFESVRAADPAHVEVLRALGGAYRRAGRMSEAIATFQCYRTATPASAEASLYLGTTLSEAGRADEALVYLAEAVERDGANPVAHIEMGNGLLRARDLPGANKSFLHATALRPFTTHTVAEPRFNVMFVLAPGFSSTPADYLVGRHDYNSHFLLWLPEASYDLGQVRAGGDVVFNLISDADQAPATLAIAGRFVDALAKPVLNHPYKILATSRAGIAARLADIPTCRVAKVKTVEGAQVMQEAAAYTEPFLIRVAGLHGGNAFERVSTLDEVKAFLAHYSADAYHLMEYLDYRSADGFFRKYRFFCVGGTVLPYHLAIADQWKVHHFRTDMTNHPWMMREEETFLEHPGTAFGAAQMDALHTIARRIGLDFMGIDCGLDRDGNVVVFEANAAMLVHCNNAAFPYKDKYVRRIKEAFDALLARTAGHDPA